MCPSKLRLLAKYRIQTNARLESADVYVIKYKSRQFHLIRGLKSQSDMLYTFLNDWSEETEAYEKAMQLCDCWSVQWHSGVLCLPEPANLVQENELTAIAAHCPSEKRNGSVVNPAHFPDLNYADPAVAWALGLRNEALCSKSPFLSLINFWKILELKPSGSPERRGKPELFAIDWINALPQEKVSVPPAIRGELPAGKTLGKYLWDDCRCAISHVTKSPFVQPNVVKDRLRISISADIAARLADHYLWTCLSVGSVKDGPRILRTRKKVKMGTILISQANE